MRRRDHSAVGVCSADVRTHIASQADVAQHGRHPCAARRQHRCHAMSNAPSLKRLVRQRFGRRKFYKLRCRRASAGRKLRRTWRARHVAVV